MIDKHIITADSFAFFALALVCVAVHFLIEPIRWAIYLRKSDKQSLLSLLYIFSSTAFFTYILPAKMGLPFRFWLISKFQQVKKTTTGIFMAVDSALTIGMWTSVSLFLGGEFALRIVSKNINKLQAYMTIQVAILGCVIGTALCLIAWKLRHKLQKYFLTARDELRSWQLFFFILLFTVDIGSYVVRHFFIIMMLPMDPLSWWTITTISIVSIFAGFVSTMPMGLVGYDATVIFLLNQQGVSFEIAVLVPVINRIANIIVSIVMGIPSAYKLGIGINLKKIKKKVGSS